MNTRHKTCYIAGPMTGIDRYNFPAFYEAADRLRHLGYGVVNPAEFGHDLEMHWEDCMKRDIPLMLTCDFVVVLPGWHESKGARLEADIANALGMPVRSLYNVIHSWAIFRDPIKDSVSACL